MMADFTKDKAEPGKQGFGIKEEKSIYLRHSTLLQSGKKREKTITAFMTILIGIVLMSVVVFSFFGVKIEGQKREASMGGVESDENFPGKYPGNSNGEDLEEFTGRIDHIFFHPLVAFPEFNRVLSALYKNDFILVGIHDIYGEIDKDGVKTFGRKKLMRPKGKKPIIISVDDLNYYEYMKEKGTVHKLILDEEGKIATCTKKDDGREMIAYDNEIIPILDSFVHQYPDFSYNNSKGTLAVTGYDVVFGYKTNRDSPIKETEIAEAKKIADALKETGWTFASHSYGHIHANAVTYERVMDDTIKWKNEVQNIVGPTYTYIYPYGEDVPKDGGKFKFACIAL